MKKLVFFYCFVFYGLLFHELGAQSVIYSENFNSSLGSCVATNSANGTWIWSNSCLRSSFPGHSAPGHAYFQGVGCQFGNGVLTTSGDLLTPNIPLSAIGGTLQFNYSVWNECMGVGLNCWYDILSVGVSINNGASFTDILSSGPVAPQGLTTNTVWVPATYNLSAYANQNVMLRFRFNSVDGIANNIDGIYVDDITVVSNCSVGIAAVSGGNTVNPVMICAGNSLTLTSNAVSNFTWSNGANTPSIVISPTVSGVYSYTANSLANCTASAAISVSVDQGLPNLSVLNTGSLGVCAGKMATLTASGANSYTWTGGIGPPNGGAFTPASTMNYTVTAANACGTSTAVATISVFPLPNIGASVNIPTLCSGSSIVLNGSGSVSGYTWYPFGIINNSAFTPAAGINVYTVSGSGANSCTNTGVITVTVYQTPTVAPVSTPTAICLGQTATLSATGALSGYTWTTVPPVYTSSMAVSPVITTTYTVIRASSSCQGTSNVVVVVNPLPNLLVGLPNPSVVCAGICATVSGQGAITYTWFPGGFQGGVITVCPNSSTNYTVVASNANCTTSATSSLTVLPNPVLSIQASTTTVCEGSPVTMTVNGANTYTWSSPIPTPQQNQVTVTDNPFTPTQYNVSGTDANGCTTTISQVILTQTAPNLTTSIANTGSFICAGQIGTLVAQGTGQVNYNWLPTGGSANTVTVNPSVSTVYTVTGMNPNNGCTSTSTIGLAVYISTFAISSPSALCKGNTATLSVAGAANSYSWSAGTPNNNDSIFVSPQNTITYYVTGMTGNCSTTQSVNIIVNPLPPVTAVAQKITICRFEPGKLMASGANSYSWTNGPATPGYTVFPTITTSYVVTGTDLNGCSKTVTVTQLVATCIGIEEQNGLAGLLSIFPNPSHGEFIIQAGTEMNITIINELGQTVRVFSLNEKETKMNISHLANGIYFIRAEKDGSSITKKMVVEK